MTPPSDLVAFHGRTDGGAEEGNESDEEFVYPSVTAAKVETVEEVPRQPHPPSPAQLESLYAAASSGDLLLLKRLFRSALENGEVEHFALANDASSRTGFTTLHAAASRGYLEIVTWRKISKFNEATAC